MSCEFDRFVRQYSALQAASYVDRFIGNKAPGVPLLPIHRFMQLTSSALIARCGTAEIGSKYRITLSLGVDWMWSL